MTDTHAHLYDEAFDADRDEALTRARVAGINKVFLPNINATTIAPMLQLCSANPGFCYPMLGLHPEDVREDWSRVLDEMEPLLQQPDHPFIAIGEVGLDFYWDQTYREEQLQAFARQIDWAISYDLPLMIHTRNTHREMVDTIRVRSEKWEVGSEKCEVRSEKCEVRSEKCGVRSEECEVRSEKCGAETQIVNCKLSNCKLHGVFHCFGGTEAEARELLAFDGFMLGIGGVVTYKKSPLPDVLRAAVPLRRIVLETDSPYLAPVPYRGKRNESAYVRHVAERLADIYQCSVEEVTQITTENALKTFPKAA